MEFHYQGHDPVRVEPTSGEYLVSIGERSHRVQIVKAVNGELTLLIDGQPVHALTAQAQGQRWVALNAQLFTLTKVEKSARRIHGHTNNNLTASMPGQIMKVVVHEGETVAQGQPLIVLEAMKMEVRLNAPHAGTVIKVLCNVGQIVERGQSLLELVKAE